MVDQTEPHSTADHGDTEPRADVKAADVGSIENTETRPAPSVKIHEEERPARDTNAAEQERAVTRNELADRLQKSDRWMIGLTAVIAIGGAVSAVVFGYQLQEMKIAADLTRKSIEISERAINQGKESLIATQRPWLSLEAEIIGPLTWKDGGIQLRVGITVKNTGLTPALHSRISAILDPGNARKGYDYCKAQRDRESYMFSQTVFPGGVLMPAEEAWAPAEEVKAALHNGEYLTPSLTVCVDYRSVFDEPSHHQTFVTFSVYRNPSISGNAAIYLKDGDLPVSDLKIEHIFGATFAD